MPQAKPAIPLCTELLPSGKLCRGAALRNHRYCRAHIARHRLLERDRQHNEAVYQLRAGLDTMDIPELLQTLEAKLDRITCIVRAYPEARVTLGYVIDRLHAVNAEMSQMQLTSNEINHLPASPNSSIR
ncbi:MAG TPA: hypothetical protein VFW25_14740 [Silvibacterium sp.]|nr:hypothetical protein [Silvibacterium sp.]